MEKPILDIIVPTYDNINQLVGMLTSLSASLTTVTCRMVRVFVVNNGKAPLEDVLNLREKHERFFILNPGKNLGWERGLKYALERSDAPYVAFMNDDIRFITGDQEWVYKVLSTFQNPAVGAVGPSSNFVMGPQNIFLDAPGKMLEVKYLIGFCMILRRKALDAAGGVDDTLPGGDDLDLSIRLRDAGYGLVALRNVFVYHHGQQTGPRVTGGNWDTQDHQSRTFHALIRKHGMLKFWETIIASWQEIRPYTGYLCSDGDVEGDLCRKYIKDTDKVLELGCGGRKTIDRATGVDVVARGALVDIGSSGVPSVADIISDVAKPLPVGPGSQDVIVARHVLEHLRDPLIALCQWNVAIKKGGRLIVAVPNDLISNTIVMSPDHRHVFTPDSFLTMAMVAGFAEFRTYPSANGVSFVCVLDKVDEPMTLRAKEVSCA